MSQDQSLEEAQPVLSSADAPESFVPPEPGELETGNDPQISADSSGEGSVRAFSADLSQNALARINQYRTQAGVPAATMHLALKAAAEAHVAYYLQNAPVSGSIHDEVPGKLGFSGQSFSDRAAHFGYPNSQSTNEDIDTIADPVAAVDRFMATLNHRIPLLDPAYPDIGIASGAGEGGKNPITVVDFGMPVWKTAFQPSFFVWPPENGTNAPRSYRGEAPDLFRTGGLNPVYPTGNPISITYRGGGTIKYDPNGMSLTDASGNPVDCYKLSNITFFTARNSAAIAATQPLAPDTTYQVTFTFSVNGGAPQVRTWRFSTGASVSTEPGNIPPSTEPQPLKPGLVNADPSVRSLWQAADGPVAAGTAHRTWLYGPDIFDALYEPYDEAPGGKRAVFYFDKARLEINNPAGNRANQWFVTSGLLVRELVSGALQLGDNHYEPRTPADVPVAGDPGTVNPNAPTYATFNALASLNNDRRVSDRTGQTILESVDKNGAITTLPTPPAAAICRLYEKTLGHNVPDVFLTWMNSLPGGWVFVLGLPLTEAIWTRVKVAGVDRDVLVQLFERRALTFTPANTSEWRVEMGNIGRHYHTWRYGS